MSTEAEGNVTYAAIGRPSLRRYHDGAQTQRGPEEGVVIVWVGRRCRLEKKSF